MVHTWRQHYVHNINVGVVSYLVKIAVVINVFIGDAYCFFQLSALEEEPVTMPAR
jgi:hypothetical protein